MSRAARIVDAVAVARNGLTQQQIADVVGLPPSTTFRLVRSLIAVGYLAFEADRKVYHLGRRIIRLFHMRMAAERIQALVEPVLHDVVHQFNQICYLTQLHNDEVRLVAFSMPHNANRTLIYPGETSLIHAQAAGKATFAFQDPELIERHLARPLAKLQPNTKTDPREIRRELAEVRRKGYAITDSEFEQGGGNAAQRHGADADLAPEVEIASGIGALALQLVNRGRAHPVATRQSAPCRQPRPLQPAAP